MVVNSIKGYGEVGENGTQKGIGFMNQKITDALQGSSLVKPDYREFYISFKDVEAVSIDYFCNKST